MKILLLFSFIILLNFSLISTIINIPADQPTIQQGIDVSVDGDTVLVQPGTYVENINYNGKNITVSSLFLTTQDTTYISQTLIDGNQNGSVVTFESEEDTTAVLCGFIITNGNSENYGGGIFCSFSNPCIKNVIIEDNYAAESGGGLFFSSIGNSYINLENVIISSNFSNSYGGGISAHSNLHCENVIITCNTAYNCGGGIYSRDNLNLVNVTVSFNCTFGNGGGIYQSGFLNFENTIVTNNTAYNSGGGIYYAGGIPQIKNVIIKNNIAYESGGGIFFYDIVDANFNIDDRCSIYMNNVIYQRGYGVDIYSLQGDNQYDIINVVVDTFSTFSPTDYYVFPIDAFTFDILHSIQDSLINSDLYVSVDGDDNNSGISESEPLRTIKHALSRIFADSLNQNTIYLLPGIYSSSTNGEIFPINWSNYVSLDGINEEETILDADTSSCVMKFNYVTDAIIKNVTIRNGYAENGGGIFCEYSNPTFENIIITENNVSHYGGGIYCKYSNPNLENVTISNNNAVCRGGGIYCWFSNPILTNVSVTYNSAEGHYSSDGGGIFCYQSSPSLENVTISNNSAIDDGGGIYCSTSSNPILQNAEISDNTIVGGSGFANGGGIHCRFSSSPTLINVIISGNSAERGGGVSCWDQSYPTFENVTIIGNTASDDGGGIYCFDSEPIFTNSEISDNYASRGGGIYCNSSSPIFENVTIINNSAGSYGGGISCYDYSCPQFNKVTFSNNSANIYGSVFFVCILSHPSIFNSIFSNNDGNFTIYVSENDYPSHATVFYCDFWNNEGGNFYNCDNLIGDITQLNANGDPCDNYFNIFLDPLFVNPENGDYHLTENSPCIDAGDPNSPLDPDGTIADIGAFYFDQESSVENDELLISNFKMSNFPNPFNPETTISFNLTAEDVGLRSTSPGQAKDVEIIIYNIKGQKIKTLLNDKMDAGFHKVIWDGRDSNGKHVSSGIYFYKLKTGSYSTVKKMLLLQ